MLRYNIFPYKIQLFTWIQPYPHITTKQKSIGGKNNNIKNAITLSLGENIPVLTFWLNKPILNYCVNVLGTLVGF